MIKLSDLDERAIVVDSELNKYTVLEIECDIQHYVGKKYRSTKQRNGLLVVGGNVDVNK